MADLEEIVNSGNLFADGGDFLCDFNWSALTELDPSLCGGWSVIFNREVPGEIRQSVHNIGTLEPLGVKILIRVRS